LALGSGANGLDSVRAILRGARQHLNDDGLLVWWRSETPSAR